MELVIANGTVVTMNVRREVLRADVVVEDGRIAAVVPRAGRSRRGRRVIDAEGMLVIPGLIHGHLHACQTLFRGSADGLELLDWLRERIWPFEAAHDAASMRASAALTFAELLRSGATAALDMGTVRHYDEVFEAAEACGFRLTGGKAMMDAGQAVPARLRESTQDSVAESVRLCERWHGKADGRLRYAFAPRFVLSASGALLTQVSELSRRLSARIHTHASESAMECGLVRDRTGKDNVELLHELGLTGPDVTLAHCVWLSAGEQRILKDTGTVVCHCPSANLKLGSGIAKAPELMEAGVTVALGADGAACNNNLDMFTELRLAALIHLPRVGPGGLLPMKVLEMATLGGAAALGLVDELGSLEVGKRADLTVVARTAPHAVPWGDDPVAHLVFAARASDVRHVLVDGQVLVHGGELVTMDQETVVRDALEHATRLAQLAS